MIDRLLIRLVQSGLDRGRPPGPRLDRWLDARPDARREADALIEADRHFRDAGMAMRGDSLKAKSDQAAPDVLARLSPHRTPLAVAALLAFAVSLISFYLFVDPGDDATAPGGQGSVVTGSAPPHTTEGAPTRVTSPLQDNVDRFNRVAQHVSMSLNGLDGLDASAIRSATTALRASYQAEADGLTADLARLLPNLRLSNAARSKDSSG